MWCSLIVAVACWLLKRIFRVSRTGPTLRATSFTASGHSIGEILTAGEWKSSAFLRYCQADNLSVSALLNVVLADDLEGE